MDNNAYTKLNVTIRAESVEIEETHFTGTENPFRSVRLKGVDRDGDRFDLTVRLPDDFIAQIVRDEYKG